MVAISQRHTAGLFSLNIDAQDVQQNLHAFAYLLRRDLHAGAAEVESAGAEVRAGQPHEGEPHPAGTAPNGHDLGLQPGLFRRQLGIFNQMVARQDLLLHVIVVMLEFQLRDVFAVLFIDGGSSSGHRGLAGLEFLYVVVADDVFQLCLIRRAAHLAQVIPPSVPSVCSGRSAVSSSVSMF